MDSRDLTPEQAAALLAKLWPMLAYVYRLRQRIDAQHFPPQDAMRLRVEAAHDALQALCVELHYLTCPGQTGGR